MEDDLERETRIRSAHKHNFNYLARKKKFVCEECGLSIPKENALKTLNALTFLLDNVNDGISYGEGQVLLGGILFGKEWELKFIGKGELKDGNI
mgnify:CR=1 FL=1